MHKLQVSDFPPVARTLLIPLAYRAAESERSDALLRDERALELASRFDEDFLNEARTSSMDRTATMMRTKRLDWYAKVFIASHPGACVVDIGCGLDCRFDRIDSGQLAWYGLDFPEVIEVRKQLLPPCPSEHLIPSSALDFAWLGAISQPVIFLAEGVSPYMKEVEFHRLVLELAQRFPGCELAFDALNRFSIWLHRLTPSLRKLKVELHWGLDNAHELEHWAPGIRLLEEWHYFDQGEPRLRAYNWMRFFPIFNNANRVLHYRLGKT